MLIGAVLLGYLIGSIPVGILACLPCGKDPRKVGSGRTGASNVYRTAGKIPAIITIVGDMLKGTSAVILASYLVSASPHQTLVMALTALAAILGHNYSIYIGFRGGAGSTPNLGAMMAFSPPMFLVAVVVAGTVWLGTRVASKASITLTSLILLITIFLVYDGQQPSQILVYGVGQLLLVVWALRPNIRRLIRGEEKKIARADVSFNDLRGR